MQIVGLILILLNMGTIVAPVAGIAIVYQDHIQDVIIPPQLTDMINDTVSLVADPITFAKFVSAEFDNVSRTATLTVNFTNPLDYTLSLKSLTAEGQCTAHSFLIGQFNLPSPIELPAAETTPIVIVCTWTQSAENHFRTEHSSETTVDINLIGFTANFNDVNLQLSDPISVFNIPIV